MRVRVDCLGVHQLWLSAVLARPDPDILGAARLDQVLGLALLILLIHCELVSVPVGSLNAPLGNRTKTGRNGFRVVVTGLVFLCLSRDLGRHLLGLLLILDLLALLLEVAAAASFNEVRLELLLEEQEFLFLHLLFGLLWLRIEIKILPLPSDLEGPSSSICSQCTARRPSEPCRCAHQSAVSCLSELLLQHHV